MKGSVVLPFGNLHDPVPRLPVTSAVPAFNGAADGKKMERKESGPTVSIAIALSLLTLILGVVGGLLVSVAVNAQWKGEMEQRIRTLEKQRDEDKQDLNAKYDYIRTQNEVNGKALARIEVSLGLSRNRR